jgi:hypothetical protein
MEPLPSALLTDLYQLTMTRKTTIALPGCADLVQLLRLIPARQCDSQRSRWITCYLVEGVTVNNPYVPSITELNNAPRGQGFKRPAYGRKRHTNVTANVRMAPIGR